MEIKVKDLRLDFNNVPQFSTTEDIEAFEKVIGQKRAVESIDLGLKMDSKEYNIFISGKTGTGKTGYIVRKIQEYSKNMPAPPDWCYVFNFEEPNAPMALSFKTGTAVKFKEDMAELIKYLTKEIPVLFNSPNYETEKNSIMEKFEKQVMNLTQSLNNRAKNAGFSIRQTPIGEFAFIPVKNEMEMTQEEYSGLNDKEKEKIDSALSELRLYSIEIIKETRRISKKMDEELKHLDDKIAESIILPKVESLKIQYGYNEDNVKYLESVKKDVIENIGYFAKGESEDKKDLMLSIFFFRRYEINIIVNNDANNGAPVLFADSTTYGHLFGNIEFENKMGNLITDFTLIKPGDLHKANGGFLIIKAHELLSTPYSWEMLKRCLNLELIFMETSKYNFDVLPISTLKPKNIPLKTKVILLGSYYIYSLLLQLDMDFEKLFKIKAEFDNEIESDSSNILNLIGFLRNYVEGNKFKHITRGGVLKLLQFSSRATDDRNYFSSSMSNLLKIVDIANYYAKNDNSTYIDENHILSAVNEDEEMHGLIKKKVLNMYKNKKYFINLEGTKVGQINGLSVVSYGDFVLGQQHRITVTTYAGRKGVIDIEREIKMSGAIHDKGIMILSGFIGGFIGQEVEISFNASIVFEQLYSGIEGDSASAAELLALLSSLSEVPIRQSLAITGSVNQLGEIQPIGGVNDKIEGFFDICSIFGLDGSHGVIIPYSNLQDLVLKDKILNAVENGLFHIYTVNSIEECLQILCDKEFINSAGYALMHNIKKRILEKLKKYNEILKENIIQKI